jgi:hypothetical protein
MVSLRMVVDEVLADRGAQMVLTEEHELVEALALDRTDEALGIGVQVGTAGRRLGVTPAEQGSNRDV